MNAGATADRVHEAVRRMILTREVRPGDRLDPALLADLLATSATPVREALNVLRGEGLVDARPGTGFHVPMVDAPALADLYAWNAEVLGVILRRISPSIIRDPDPASGPDQDVGSRTARLTERIAGASRNEEHLRAVRDLNARLHPARLVEADVLDDTDAELSRLTTAFEAGDLAALRVGWRRYYQRRQRAASEIVRALLRD